MLDLLPTSATIAGFVIWPLVMVGAGVVTLATVALSARVEQERDDWRVWLAPAALLALAVINLCLAVRARDVFWSDTWVSAFLLGVAVVVAAALAVFGARDSLQDAELTALAIASPAALTVVGILLWMFGHVVDTVTRALPPIGAFIVAGVVQSRGLKQIADNPHYVISVGAARVALLRCLLSLQMRPLALDRTLL